MGNHAPVPAPAPAPGSHHDAAGPACQPLTAIAARLTTRGIASRLTRIGGTPVLTIDQPTPGPDPVTITIDPRAGTGTPVECTCLWTPAPGTTPETTADTVATILTALCPAMNQAAPPEGVDAADACELQMSQADMFPWLRFLSAGDVRAFLVELIETAHACVDLGSVAALSAVVAAWQETAEIHSEPELLRQARQPLDDGDYGAVPEVTDR